MTKQSTKVKNQNRRGKRANGRKRNKTLASNPGQLANKPPVVRYTPDVFGFPDRLLTRLRYCDVGFIAMAAGALGNQVFRWNSTFDPDLTGTGHQPLYRDTYAAVYDQYSVIKARAKITLMNYSTSVGILCGVVIDDDASLASVPDTLMEQSHGISSFVTPLSGSKSEWEVSLSWDCQGILNINPFTSETYKTAVGSNPSEVSTLGIWAIPEDFSSTTTLRWKIELEQQVLWSELVTPTQS